GGTSLSRPDAWLQRGAHRPGRRTLRHYRHRQGRRVRQSHLILSWRGHDGWRLPGPRRSEGHNPRLYRGRRHPGPRRGADRRPHTRRPPSTGAGRHRHRHRSDRRQGGPLHARPDLGKTVAFPLDWVGPSRLFSEIFRMRKSTLPLFCAGLLGLGMFAALAQDAPRFGTWGVDLSAMDKSVRPGDNFSDYVTGTWAKSAVIPPDRSRIGGFTDLQILSEKRLRAIIDELHTRPANRLTVDERKLRDFYDSWMNTAAIEAKGL